VGEEPGVSLAARFDAWRGDRRIVATVCACLAVAAAIAWWRAGTSSADVPDARVASEPTTVATSTTTVAATELIVNVVGAVRAPGVVRVDAGARVVDAIAAAGGADADADLVRLNLAAPVADGARIAVPKVGEPAPALDPAAVSGGGGGGSGGGGPTDSTGPINLNTATAAELEELPGIGPATAAAIVSDRDAHGPFASVDDLSRVRGIGPAKLEQLADLVTV
jgi:competence protein ComEA